MLLLLLLLTGGGMPGMATFTPDRGHMLAILADCFTTLATRYASLIRAELVCIAGCVGGAPPFRRDRALFVLVHRGKTTVAGASA